MKRPSTDSSQASQRGKSRHSARRAIASATHVPSTNTARRSTAVEGSRGSARPAVTQNASSTRAAAVARRAWRAIRARRTRE